MDADSDLELSPSEHRKTTKPIMEKRRRARINASLTELKSLLLEVMKKEGTRHHKMEKADILEMTVKHLRQLQRTQFTAAVTSDPSVLNKYQSGFAECATEVSRYLATVDTKDVDLKTRLLNHLANTLQRPNTSPVPMTVTSSVGPITAHVRPTPIQPTILTASDPGSPINLSTKVTAIVPEINNNTIPASQGFMPAVAAQPAPQQTTAKLVSGVQLIPSRLPSGEVAFVIPGNVLATSQMSNYVIPLYAGPAPAQPQISPPAGTSRPMVVSPPVPVSLPQTPIMILPSPSSLSPASDSSKTSPDSSTHNVGVESRQELIASPTLRDSTNRNVQFQHNNDLDMKMESDHLKAPAQVAQPAPLVDENMWRPW